MPDHVISSHGLRPYPGLTDRSGKPARGRLLARMRAVLDDVAEAGFDLGEPDPSADHEDFWEDALRISSTLRAAQEAGLGFRRAEAPGSWRPEDLARRMGPVSQAETGTHASDALEAVLQALDPELTGRSFQRCGYLSPHEVEPLPTETVREGLSPDCQRDLITVLRTMYWRGEEAAVVKAAGIKQGVVRIELDDDAQALHDQLFDEEHGFGWTMVRLEGVPEAFIASPWVQMTHEYRLFVVDGVPVTGAGCIEEFTPLDHDPVHGPFDPFMRCHRGNMVAASHDSPVARRDGMVSLYLSFLDQVLQRLPDGVTVVVDLAYDDLGEAPLVVEFNAVPNSGLYACDVDLLGRALVGARDRGYSLEPLR